MATRAWHGPELGAKNGRNAESGGYETLVFREQGPMLGATIVGDSRAARTLNLYLRVVPNAMGTG